LRGLTFITTLRTMQSAIAMRKCMFARPSVWPSVCPTSEL